MSSNKPTDRKKEMTKMEAELTSSISSNPSGNMAEFVAGVIRVLSEADGSLPLEVCVVVSYVGFCKC